MASKSGGGADETEDDKVMAESTGTSESLEEIDAKDAEEADDDETSMEMVSATGSDESPLESPSKSDQGQEDTRLAGWLKLIMSGLGFRKSVKQFWFVYSEDSGKLTYYRQPDALVPQGEIDVRNASFTYTTNRDKPGLFEIRSENKVFNLDAGDRFQMIFWLEALQNKRRAYNQRRSKFTQSLTQIITGENPYPAVSGLLGQGNSDSEISPLGSANPGISSNVGDASGKKFWSPLNLQAQIRSAFSGGRMEALHIDALGNQQQRPNRATEEWTIVDDNPSPPPPSALVLSNPVNTQWHVAFDVDSNDSGHIEPMRNQTIPGTDEKENLCTMPNNNASTSTLKPSGSKVPNLSDIPTTASSSTTTLPSPLSPTSPNSMSNGKSKFMSVLRNNFKMVKEVKDKHWKSSRPSLTSPMDMTESSSQSCIRCKMLGDDLFSVKEDLKSAEEELEANREIVRLLQKEVDVIRHQIATRGECDGTDEKGVMLKMFQKDKHIVELEHSRAAIMEEKSITSQRLRLVENELKDLKEQISMFQQTLAVKDEMIVSLTNQNQEMKSNNTQSTPGESVYLCDPVSLAAEKKEMERLMDTCRAYESQNAFLTNEIIEIYGLRQNDEARERVLMMNIAKLEAQYCQTKSKYLYLLQKSSSPVRGGEEAQSQETVNRLLQEALESETSEEKEENEKNQNFVSTQGKEYDHYGFLKAGQDGDDILFTRAKLLESRSVEMEHMIRDADETTSRRIKWENYMVGLSPTKPLTHSNDVKALIRLGVPHMFRERIWRGCIDLHVHSVREKLGPNYYQELEVKAKNNKSNPANKQIELDLLRTLPDNRFFDKIDSSGVRKLRRVLLCYSVHNPCIGYCQGLNRIAAIALLFLCEEDAFWCMVAIIEHIMPPDYYTTTLAAAQVDQRVLKELVQEKYPKLFAHLEAQDVDLSLFTFNWFLTIFVDGLEPELFLRVWDSFLYEGSKVLFRFSLAFLKYSEEKILNQSNNLSMNRFMRTIGQNITDIKKMTNIAFSELNHFPMRSIANKRQSHMNQVKIELDELDAIRKDFKSAKEESEVVLTRQSMYCSDDDLDEPQEKRSDA